MQIIYKPKRHSSGLIRGGEIILYISSRLPRHVQQEHIRVLTRKLEARLNEPDPPAWGPPSEIADDVALRRRAEHWNRLYGFAMGKVCFRKQESRWGSCSGLTRNIYLSHRLKGAPLDLIDYVLIHEICHLKGLRPPHGAGFWQLVARACREYRQRRAQLAAYGRWLDTQGS
jgi:predicted metal-dependent hydrolase